LYVVAGLPTFRVEVKPFHDILNEIANQAVYQVWIPLDLRVAILIGQGEKRV
jgi:hypothetical protein